MEPLLCSSIGPSPRPPEAFPSGQQVQTPCPASSSRGYPHLSAPPPVLVSLLPSQSPPNPILRPAFVKISHDFRVAQSSGLFPQQCWTQLTLLHSSVGICDHTLSLFSFCSLITPLHCSELLLIQSPHNKGLQSSASIPWCKTVCKLIFTNVYTHSSSFSLVPSIIDDVSTWVSHRL